MKNLSYVSALIPVIVLIILLSFNLYVFGDLSLEGANQLALLFAASIAFIISLLHGVKWKELLEGIKKSIGATTSAMIILLLIGALTGTWLISGIVPAMIYYGLQILNPDIFLFATCIICAIVSLSTGSSWSTIATVGIALLAIGNTLGVSNGITAGAIISGAYFGDKMSPLSDTTNLAPAMSGVRLFSHIKYMMYTTIPSFSITLLIFLFIGLKYDSQISSDQIQEMLSVLSKSFNITPLLFIAPILVIIMIIKKIPAIPSLFFGIFIGGVFSVIFQSHIINELSNKEESNLKTTYQVVINSMSSELNFTNINRKINNIIPIEYSNSNNTVQIQYDSAMKLDQDHPAKIEANKRQDLLKSGGMSGMLNTIWLIICAMCFGGVMESGKLLERISRPIINRAKKTGNLITSTSGTCIFFNLTTGDQYLSIVVPGRMFANAYNESGLAPENLSRTLEDSGTVTSVLVPWNTCGAAQSAVLGVATLTYLPFCFFNIISPFMTIVYAYMGFKIKKLNK